ncbi:hypothetical protein FGM00_13825 [Aggregatimonas sangjinii]|uniref:Uncharacterized protein n=1 Tax=Aggregatimonas sangjinii TaxID=2583587 RepID=A0A5B7SV30_9FLAO|nr:hypothetical protein [Aggregatimonas sangjinii]QCX01139.1 hypothetical protein FGM00_13825 [Aggregatimonas sangjinii]
MKTVVFTALVVTIVLLGIPISCQKDSADAIVVSGLVIDRDTKQGIPNMKIRADGVAQFGLDKRIESGNAHTDGNGAFDISIKSIENAAFYEFFVNLENADSYTEESDYHGQLYLDSITEYEVPMVFELSKIEPLHIHLKNTEPFDDEDFVSLYFYSEKMGFERVKSVENYGAENLKYQSSTSNEGTRTEWVGANVNAVIKGNILVDEELTIIVSFRKNGQLTEVVKTLEGKRNKVNEIHIDY